MGFWQYFGIFYTMMALVFGAVFFTSRRRAWRGDWQNEALFGILFSAFWFIGVPALLYMYSWGEFGPKPITGFTLASDEKGYWLLGRRAVIAFGSAHSLTFKESVKTRQPLRDDPHIYYTPSGRVFAGDGQATFGDLISKELQAPIVRAVLTLSRKGYWLVGADGSVFAFGDAECFGGIGHAPKDYGVSWPQPKKPLNPRAEGPNLGKLMSVQVPKQPEEESATAEEASSPQTTT